MRDRFTAVTGELLDTDPRAALVFADTGLDRFAPAGILERHPHRAINVGIREQLMVGVAAGLALEGYRPIAHSYAPFLIERAFEQVKLDLGHQGVGAVLVSTGASYDAADSGRTHHAPGDVSLMATLPGWEIHVPGHADEVEWAMRRAMTIDSPVYIRLSEAANRDAHARALNGSMVVRESSPTAPLVIAVGPMLDRVLDSTQGRDVTVAYTATVAPLDLGSIRGWGATDVAIVEPTLEGTSLPGLSTALSDMPRRFLGIGVSKTELRCYGTPAQHDAAYGLDPGGIRKRLEAFWS
ncbi:MAG: transketolase family protein [Gemmatimonadota bacterium]